MAGRGKNATVMDDPMEEIRHWRGVHTDMPDGFWHAGSKDEDGELVGAFVRCPQCCTPKFIHASDIDQNDQADFRCGQKGCPYGDETTVILQHWTETRIEMESKK